MRGPNKKLDRMKVLQEKAFDSDKMRRLYVIRVFILCKDESLSLVRRTIASIKNAYLPDGCELKLYLLDENRDNVKRDFFMGMKTGTDVIYITPPVRSESSKVSTSVCSLPCRCLQACQANDAGSSC